MEHSMSTKITSPIEGFTDRSTFGPVTLDFTDGVAEHDGDLSPGLKAYLKNRGYKVGRASTSAQEQGDGPFDPAKHNVKDVLAYLQDIPDDDAEAHDAEVVRVVEAEKAGQARKSLLEAIGGTPEDPPVDPETPDSDQDDGGASE